MESGDIKDFQITESSFESPYDGEYGRLNGDGFWLYDYEIYDTGTNADPWIQVDLLRSTIVTGIKTQGDPTGVSRVRYLRIEYGDSEKKLMYILAENGQPKVSIFTFF